jgi:hypothetical protein
MKVRSNHQVIHSRGNIEVVIESRGCALRYVLFFLWLLSRLLTTFFCHILGSIGMLGDFGFLASLGGFGFLLGHDDISECYKLGLKDIVMEASGFKKHSYFLLCGRALLRGLFAVYPVLISTPLSNQKLS